MFRYFVFYYLQWRDNLKCINNGKKIEAMHDKQTTHIMAAWLWHDRLQRTGLGWLQDTSYNMIYHSLICAFVDRWHKETSSFHLPFGEMAVTLDDVSCLLHLPIDGMLVSHEAITWDDTMELMVTHLGSDPGEAHVEMTKTKGAHFRFGYLQRIFKLRMKEQLELETEHGLTQEARRMHDQAVRIYLLYVVGTMLFTDKSQNDVDVV